MGFNRNDVANVGLDQYRAAVNYGDMAKDNARTDGKQKANKGYVRFSTSGRSVVVTKVNNKVDVFIDLALRVNATNNRLIRQQFLTSIREDLKFVPQDRREEIERLILTGNAEYGRGTDEAKPLSRRDIADVFARFDAQYNTAQGRKTIIRNILADAAGRAGFKGNVEGFCQAAFGCSSEEFVLGFSSAFAAKAEDAVTAEDRLAGRTLVHGEADFRAMLVTIRQIVDRKVTDVSLDAYAERTLAGWSDAVEGDFGFELDETVKAKWKEVLRPVLDRYPGVRDLVPKDVAGTDFPGLILGLFVDRILPLEYKTAIRNVQALGIPADTPEFRDAAKTYLNVDSVRRLAESFFAKATDAKFLKALDRLAGDGNDPQVQKARSLLGNALAGIRDVGLISAAKMGTANEVMMGAAVSKAEALAIGESNRGAIGVFTTESRLDWYALCFVAERYGEGEFQVGDARVAFAVVRDVKTKIEDATKKIVVAAQLQHGQRFVEKAEVEGKEKVVGVKSGAGGFEQFVGKVVDRLVDEKTLKELKCSSDEILEFATLTLPNVFASKRDALFLQNAGEAEKADLFDSAHVDEAVAALKKGYAKLGKEVAAFDKTTRKFAKAFNKLVERYVAGLRLSFEAGVQVKLDLEDVLKRVRTDAARELGGLMPLDTDAKAARAKTVMSEAAERFRGEMNRRLSSLLLARGYSCQVEKDKAPVPGVTAFDVGKNVNRAMTDWETLNGPLVADAHGLHLVDGQEIKNRLFDRLTDAFHATLAQKLPKDGHRVSFDQFADIRKAFAKKVDETMSAFRKLASTFEDKFLAYGTDVLVAMMKAGDEPFADGKTLTPDQRKAFAEDLVRNVMVANREKLRETLFAIAGDPADVSKGDVVKSVWDEIGTGGFGKKVGEILADRVAELETWLEQGAFRDRLEADVFAYVKTKPGADALTDAELRELVHANVEPFFAETDAHRAFAASGGKAAFCRRTSAAALTGLEKRIAGFAALKKAFAAEADKADGSYETLPGKAELRSELLVELAREATVPDAKTAGAYYLRRLDAKLRGFINERQEAFADYALTYRVAFGELRDLLEPRLESFKGRLDVILSKVLLSESDDRPELFLGTAYAALRARIFDVYAWEIARDPDGFLRRGEGEKTADIEKLVGALAERLEADLLQVAAGVVSEETVANAGSFGLVPWERTDALLERLGFGDYVVKGNAITEGLRRHLSETMKTPDYAALKRAAIPALVDRAWAEARGLAVPKAAQDAIEAYDAFVRKAANEYVTTNCNIETLSKDVRLATARIELELARRELPEVRDNQGTTVRDRARMTFYRHVKAAADEMFALSAKGETYGETLLTQEFFDDFIRQIEKDSFATLVERWRTQTVEDILANLTSKASSWSKCFVVDPSLPDEIRRRCEEVARANRVAVETAVSAYVLNFVTEKDSAASLADPVRQEELRKGIVQNADRVLAQALTDSLSRMNFELELDHAVDTAVRSYEEILFLRMFAVPDKSQAVYLSLAQLYGDTTLPVPIRDGNEYGDHRAAIRSLCSQFRKSILADVETKRQTVKNLTETTRSVNLVKDFGNAYLGELLNDPKRFATEKKLLNAFADAIASAKGIKIERGEYGFDVPGLFSFLTGLFKKNG